MKRRLMKQGWLRASGLLATSAALASLVVGTAAAQTQTKAAGASKPYSVPKTAWGDPDLQGLFANNNATPLERPKELADRQFLTEAEVDSLKKHAAELFNGETDAAFGDSVYLAALRAAQGTNKGFTSTDTTGNYNHFWLVDREFDNRTSLITDPPDGRVPAMTPAAQKREADRLAVLKAHPFDGPENIPLSERCVTRGVPPITAGYNSYYQIVQAPGYVVVHMEMMHDSRIIPLDNRPRPSEDVKEHLGNSRGHWEGNTLVVETTNLTAKPNGTSQIRVSTSDKLRLVERFTRVSANTIQYEATISDPETWTRPWTVMIPWKQTTDQIHEFACHEGNESMVGTLGGARIQEKAAAAAKGSN